MHIDLSGDERAASAAPEAVRFLTALLIIHRQLGAVRLIDGGGTIIFEFFLTTALKTAPFREFHRDLREAYDAYSVFCNLHVRHFLVRRTGKIRSSSGSMIAVLDSREGEGLPSDCSDFWRHAYRSGSFEESIEEGTPLLPYWLESVDSEWEAFSDATDSVRIERDLSTLSLEEISLLIQLVQQELKDYLVVAPGIEPDEDLKLEEHEVMDSALDIMQGKVQRMERLAQHLLEEEALSGANTEAKASAAQAPNAYPNLVGYREDMRVVVFASDE